MKLFFVLFLICFIIAPVFATLPDASQMEEIGERAAYVAMKQLNFDRGDQNLLVLTNAGKAEIDGVTTEKAISGLTTVSGLQNGDGTLFQVNRANNKPLWFYFFNKKSGKGLYLVPDSGYYSMNTSGRKAIQNESVFTTVALVTGDLDKMLADPDFGNETQQLLGGNSFSLISISNAWSHGAPYDLLTAAAFHNHFCPGLGSGYMMARYVEKEMPITNGTSYVVISSPTSCKDDVFPILWDLTPGKGGEYIKELSNNETALLNDKYGTTPKGIIIRWDSKKKIGDALVLGSVSSNTSTYSGPEWLAKPLRTVEMVENITSPEKYVSTIFNLTIDEHALNELKDPSNNPYEVIDQILDGNKPVAGEGLKRSKMFKQ